MGQHLVEVGGVTLTATVDELVNTGPFGTKTHTRNFVISFAKGTTPTDAHALQALLAEAGSAFMSIPFDDAEVTPSENAVVYYGSAHYRQPHTGLPPEPPEGYADVLQGTTRGARQKITQSLATTGYAASGNAPDEGGAIGYDGETVNGVEIDIPTGQWSKTKRVAKNNAETFLADCIAATGTVNSDTFNGYPAGSVKFLGADFNQEDNSYAYFTLHYAYSPNASSISIGGISGISKAGWDVLDVRYADDVDGNAKSILKKPLYVYVHQVYPRGTLPS